MLGVDSEKPAALICGLFGKVSNRFVTNIERLKISTSETVSDVNVQLASYFQSFVIFLVGALVLLCPINSEENLD
jgi:hypothetical protein